MRPDNHRRKWDREEFGKLAQERIRKENDEEDNRASSSKKAKTEEEEEEDDDGLSQLVNHFLNFPIFLSSKLNLKTIP